MDGESGDDGLVGCKNVIIIWSVLLLICNKLKTCPVHSQYS